MTAVDLATGRVIWTEPFGTATDTGPLGLRSHLPLSMGVPFSGGGITTRGGLTFIAASVEQAIRAYDVTTGRELWKARLPAGGQATPMTYRAPRSGTADRPDRGRRQAVPQDDTGDLAGRLRAAALTLPATTVRHGRQI